MGVLLLFEVRVGATLPLGNGWNGSESSKVGSDIIIGCLVLTFVDAVHRAHYIWEICPESFFAGYFLVFNRFQRCKTLLPRSQMRSKSQTIEKQTRAKDNGTVGYSYPLQNRPCSVI